MVRNFIEMAYIHVNILFPCMYFCFQASKTCVHNLQAS